MPSPKGIRAGRAFVELSADDSKLVRGLKRAQYKLRAFGRAVGNISRQLMGLGAAVFAPLAASAKAFSSMGDAVAKMAKRTGFSVEALSELKFVASQTGTELGAMENGLRRMQRSIYDAGRGLSTAVDGLADLGLKFKDLDGLAPEEQFKLLADRISQVEDPTKRAAIAMSLFGRSGTALLPMMAGGAAGISELQQAARDLGLTMTEEDTRAAEEFTDTLDKLWKVVKMGAFRVGQALAPALQEAAAGFMDVVHRATEWISKNRETIVTTLKVAAAMIAVGAAALVLAKVVGVVAAIITVVKAAVVAVKALAVAFTWLMANPVALAFAAIAVAVTATFMAIRALTYDTAELSNEMGKLLEKGDEQRKADLLRIQRLEQLAEKERLNSREMSEAANLIGKLQGRYGDLGIVLDETTGKIDGLAGAHGKLAEAMRKATLAQIAAEIAERRRNIRELQDEIDSVWFSTSKIEELSEKRGVESGYLRALMARRRALEAGDEGALTGGPDEQEALRRKMEATRAAGEAEAEWARRVHQLKLQQIEDRKRREMALIDERYDHELKRARQAAADAATLAQIDQARKLELAAVERKFAQEAAQERQRQLEEERRARARMAEQAQAANLSRAASIEDLYLRTTFKGIELQKALLELQKRQAIAAAKAAGENIEMVEIEFFLRKKLLDQGRATKDVQQNTAQLASAGTFLAANVLGLQAGSAADRMANGIDKIERNTRPMRDAEGIAFA